MVPPSQCSPGAVQGLQAGSSWPFTPAFATNSSSSRGSDKTSAPDDLLDIHTLLLCSSYALSQRGGQIPGVFFCLFVFELKLDNCLDWKLPEGWLNPLTFFSKVHSIFL